MIIVCNKCFKKKEECECKKRHSFVEIDDNILPIIKILNEKGYRTEFCCEGHPNHEGMMNFGYIKFLNENNFLSMPNIDKKILWYNRRICAIEFKLDGTFKEQEQVKEQVLNELMIWSNQLEGRKING